MLYKCDQCDYTTKRQCDLRRHKARKIPCNKNNKVNTCNNIRSENIHSDGSDLHPNGSDLHPNGSDLHPNGSDLHDQSSNIHSQFKCIKCQKVLTSKRNLLKHQEKCEGLQPNQCRICLKIFASSQSKYNHTHYVKCSPPASAPSSSNINNTTINNTNNNTNNTTNNNIDNSINNITNNNITIRNDFYSISEADIDRIVERLEEKEYFKIAMNNVDIGRYAIPRTVERIYFNEKHPDMQTLKKERRNDKMVDVHVGNGKWEKRFMDDVFKLMIRRVEEYHAKFFRQMEEKYKNVPTGSMRWKQLMRPVKTFGNMMLWYEGFRGDMIEGLGVELNYPDEDDPEIEKERERRNREMEQLVGEKVYEETAVAARHSRAVTVVE